MGSRVHGLAALQHVLGRAGRLRCGGELLVHRQQHQGRRLDQLAAGGNIPLPGLSDNVWNATLYYEKHGFSARVAGRYRSEYIGEVTNFANERGLRFVQDDMIVDAQVSYEFGGGALDGLQVLLQANNLTNEPYIAYSQIEDRLLDYQEYGSQYLIGLNYKF